MKKLLLVSAVAAPILMASGYKIPEQSLNSTALAGAYVSNATTADAAYFNPANMAFMNTDRHLELNAMYIHLNPIDFSGQVGGPTTQVHTAQSASEDFLIPQIYIVSKPIGEDESVRLGLSINEPAGLSKRWPEGIESQFAEEFTVKVIEVNPTIAYKIMENFAIAAGVRFVYTQGVVKVPYKTIPQVGTLDVEGSSWNIGWNAALSYKPMDMWGVALTYRSEVNMDVEGGQSVTNPLYVSMGLTSIPASVSIPLPAVVTLATDVSITDSTNVEFVYERVFWSAYDKLQFTFDGQAAPAQPKNWEDSNTFRLGLTQGFGDSLDIMLGVAYDETPVPDQSLGFELPDSNAVIFSGGVRWAMTEEVDIGISALYDIKEDRFVSYNDNENYIDGTFSGSSAFLLSVGLGYKF